MCGSTELARDGAEEIQAEPEWSLFAHHQQVVLRLRQHAIQAKNFGVGIRRLARYDELHRTAREFLAEQFHHLNRGIVGFTHREKQFEIGIVLREEAPQVGLQPFVDACQRLQYADGSQRAGRRGSLRQVIPHRDHYNHAIRDCAC